MPSSVPDFGRFRVTKKTFRRPKRAAFKPLFALHDSVYEDLRAVERADVELRRFDVDAIQARALLEDALTRNAYGTASIEGNPLSLEDVQSLLERGPTPDALKRPEEREIFNFVGFMETLPKRSLPSTAADILSLHRTLFQGVLPDAGRFKDKPNFVGTRPSYEVSFVPAMPDRVRPELENALDWLRSGHDHPLVRIEVFFHEFESIHPFRDGNGRAGRALTTWLLYASGYPGVRYALVDYEFNRDREGYYGALAQVERSGFEYSQWIAYMSRILRRTFEGAVERFAFDRTLPAEFNNRQRALAMWFRRLNADAPRRQVKFADVHAAHPSITERTLKRDLVMLRDTGITEAEGVLKGTRYRLSADRRPAARM